MTTATDLQRFSSDERKDRWNVWIEVHTQWPEEITAATAEEALAKVESLIAANSLDVVAEPGDFRVVRVRSQPPIYRVLRDGLALRVSHVQPGDQPREPDERGF